MGDLALRQKQDKFLLDHAGLDVTAFADGDAPGEAVPAGAPGEAVPADAPVQAGPTQGGAAPADAPADGPAAPSPGAELVNDKAFQRLVEIMEADGDDADAQWQTQINDSVFNYLDPSQKTAYSQDRTLCVQAQGDFTAEWNKVVFGGGDVAKLLQTYDVFSLRIGALQRSNERVEALISLDLEVRLGVLLVFLRKWSQNSYIYRVGKTLERLKKELEQAEHEVTNAKVKVALNLVVSAITLVVAPEEVLAKVAYSVGAMGVHIAIDRTLGEGSATGTVVFVAGDSKEVIELSKEGGEALEKLKVGGKRLGVAGAAVTAVLDIKEVYEGKEKVEHIKDEIEELEKLLEALVAGSAEMLPKLVALDTAIQALRGVLAQIIAKGNDAAQNYGAIKAKIEEVLKEGP